MGQRVARRWSSGGPLWTPKLLAKLAEGTRGYKPVDHRGDRRAREGRAWALDDQQIRGSGDAGGQDGLRAGGSDRAAQPVPNHQA